VSEEKKQWIIRCAVTNCDRGRVKGRAFCDCHYQDGELVLLGERPACRWDECREPVEIVPGLPASLFCEDHVREIVRQLAERLAARQGSGWPGPVQPVE
jgi:hypothetical protein